MKNILIALILAFFASSSVLGCPKNNIEESFWKFNGIQFNKIEYDKVSLLKVIDDLMIKSKEVDSDKKGANIIFLEPPSKEERPLLPVVTLKLEDVRLYDVIEVLCDTYDLEYSIDDNAIVISRKNASVNELKFRIYDFQFELFLLGHV